MKLEVDKPEVTDLVVVYSGRFQPFHAGHYVSYLKLCAKFGKNNVYIATSNSTSGPKSPFNFNEKKEIATKMFNVPSNKFIQVTNPYAPKEILQGFDEKTTAYIAAVGEKDESRLSGKYFKPYKGKTGYGYDEIGYTYAVPAESNPISGTDVRNWLGSGDDESKKKGFLKAYPKFNADIFKMITNKLNEDGFPGGIGTGLNLPGGYINGAPTGSANESNNTQPSTEFRKEPHPTRHETEHPSDEPNWHKNENLYDPIGHIIDRVLAEEMFKEFVDSYFTEAPNPIMDKEIDYTASDGNKKKITVKGALRLAKDHPAHIQASKMVGGDTPNAMAKGPTDAPANEPNKLPEPGKAAAQSAKPAEPGQPTKQGQTQQGKADKEKGKAGATPQGADAPPPEQKLSGAELKSSAEKTPEDKKAEKQNKFKEFFKSATDSVKKQAEALWNDFNTEEHHDAHEMTNPDSELRKSITQTATDFITNMPKNIVKGAYDVVKHKYHQFKNTAKGVKSLATSLSHGKGFQFGYEKGKDGKWGVNKHEAEKQKKAAISTVKDTAKIAAAVVTGGALSGVVGHVAGGGALGTLGQAALSGAGETLSHGVTGFVSHMAVDFAKHCGFEALGLGAGIDLEQAEKMAARAGLTQMAVTPHLSKIMQTAMGALNLSEDTTPENEEKQHADLLMNMLKTVLEKMKDFKPSPEQMFATMQSYSEVKKKNAEKEKGAVAANLLKPIHEQISPLKKENISHFVEYASKRLNLKEQPSIVLVEDPEFSRQNHSLGGYNVDSKQIFVATEGRLTADILRTIAHEMVHRKQDEMGLIGDSVKDGATGSEVENKANSVAAILLREYGKLNKTIYNEDINIDVDKGDTVLMGKFKNKKVVAKDFGTDDHGMPTINGKVATTFRIPRGEQKPNPQSVFDEVTTNDWHFKAIMKLYDKSNSFGKKKIAAAVCSDPNASRRDIVVQLRDSDYEEVTAMTDKLRLSEYIEKKKLSEISESINTKNHKPHGSLDKNFNLHHKSSAYAPDYGYPAELDTIDFDDKRKNVPGYQPNIKDTEDRGYEPVKTEKLSQSNLNSVEKYADRELDPADIEFSNHFFDRVNDTRNGKEISEPELTGFFKRLSRHKKQFIDFLDKYNQIVVKDERSDINIPFVKMANKVIAKTVMRKGDFQTSSPTIVNEITQGLYGGTLKIGGKPVEIEVELLGADNKTKEFLTKIIHIDKEYQRKLPIGSTFRIPARIFRLPGGGWHKIKSSAFNESDEPSDIIKDLDKVRHDLIKKVDVLIAKKKKLYSNVDIESPMSADEKQLDKDIQSIFSQIQDLIQQKRKIKKPINEGGAYGHMSHPFDDMKLTFGDLKNIITGALTGKLELTREKTDGQALAISWKNGRLIAARNKSHLANAGAGAMGIEDVASKFAGRGGLTDAYNFAMKDLSAAISSLSEPQRKKIFDEGKCFMNLEVIWPTSVNVIPYGQPLLVFHNTTCYDETGKAVGADQSAARTLAGMIKQVNGDVQSKYTIQGPPVTQLPTNQELDSKQTKYLTQLQKLQFQFQLSNKDGVADYHRAWWENFIDKSKVKLQKLEKDALINRWAFGDKSFRLNTISDKDAQKWAIDNDKVNVANQQKENIRPFEEIFLGVGADVLSFMGSVLTANPNAAVANMKQRLKDTADKVRGSGDASKIDKLKKELARLQSIGGLDKIVPNEGIVFIYKGNTYKLTGTFAPLNQILGIFYE